MSEVELISEAEGLLRQLGNIRRARQLHLRKVKASSEGNGSPDTGVPKSSRECVFCANNTLEMHISDSDLKRYELGTILDQAQLVRLEEHLVCCPLCMDRFGQKMRSWLS